MMWRNLIEFYRLHRNISIQLNWSESRTCASIILLMFCFIFLFLCFKDEFVNIITAAVGSVTFNGCYTIGWGTNCSSTSCCVECLQFIFFRIISDIGRTISPSDCDSWCYIWLDRCITHVHVLGRSERFRRANLNLTIVGWNAWNQGSGRYQRGKLNLNELFLFFFSQASRVFNFNFLKLFKSRRKGIIFKKIIRSHFIL